MEAAGRVQAQQHHQGHAEDAQTDDGPCGQSEGGQGNWARAQQLGSSRVEDGPDDGHEEAHRKESSADRAQSRRGDPRGKVQEKEKDHRGGQQGQIVDQQQEQQQDGYQQQFHPGIDLVQPAVPCKVQIGGSHRRDASRATISSRARASSVIAPSGSPKR